MRPRICSIFCAKFTLFEVTCSRHTSNADIYRPWRQSLEESSRLWVHPRRSRPRTAISFHSPRNIDSMHTGWHKKVSQVA